MLGRIISHYTILSLLGEGGMEVVYKAQDAKLARTVASKSLELTASPSFAAVSTRPSSRIPTL